MRRKNKLAPEKRLQAVENFLLNLFWAIVWLGRWIIRGVQALWKRGM